MKVFISSVVRGMEAYRNAARGAVAALGHQPMLAEQLPATSDTPERACLSEVRSAGAFILLLGTRYGDPQESGLSATHEEYLEARDRMPVFVFPQRSIKMENPQEQFLSEAQGWSTGHFVSVQLKRDTFRLQTMEPGGITDEREARATEVHGRGEGGDAPSALGRQGARLRSVR